LPRSRRFRSSTPRFQGNEIVYKPYHDIGMAVGAEGGLVVPVLRDADKMAFAEIEKAIRAYAQKAADSTPHARGPGRRHRSRSRTAACSARC
jgi:pyruvate/2-oxoglutarate dehydrogenase complex dihydrolipoamide acyltransferase (E2) component